jgi:PurA ssDNA and RNA-binding protein
MISNERPSHFGNRSPGYPPKPPVNEDTLKTGTIQIERKAFVFALKENPRGRFLRITEDAGGRRNTIIIPAPGLEDFKNLLDEMVKACEEPPSPIQTDEASMPQARWPGQATRSSRPARLPRSLPRDLS